MKDSLDFLQNYCEEIPDESISEPDFVVHDALNILRTDVICHHGILGMKWGVRRYQNKDGSLTAAGKKRYYGDENNYEKGWSWGGGNLTKKGEKAFKNRKGEWKNTPGAQKAKEHEERNKRLKAESDAKTKKAVEYVNGEYEKDISKMNSMTQKDWDNAADLGLKTLAVTKSGLGQGEIKSSYDKNDRFWFLKEDQTIGLGEVAAMVSKGYSADHIDKVLSNLDGATQYDVTPKSKFGNSLLFGSSETGKDALTGFARQCENVNYLDKSGYSLKTMAPGERYEWHEYTKDTPKYKLEASGDSLQYTSVKASEESFKKNADGILKAAGEEFYKQYKDWMYDDISGKDIPKETVIKNLLKEKPSVNLVGESIWLWSPDAQHYVEAHCDFKNKKIYELSLQG